MNNEALLDWIFNYNPYDQTWRACKREDYLLLFSNPKRDEILKSSKIETLIDVIVKNININQLENE